MYNLIINILRRLHCSCVVQQTPFCVRYRCVAVCVRIGCELIGRRIDETKFLLVHVSTYCTLFSFEPFLADPFHFILSSIPPF